MRVEKANRLRVLVVAAALLPCAAGGARAQEPEIDNAQVTVLEAAPDLTTAVRRQISQSGDPAWIGYAVEGLTLRSRYCCGEPPCTCRLEEEFSQMTVSGDEEAPSDWFWVLLRAESGKLGRIRVLSGNCKLDAGGRPFFWFGEARSGDSLELLAGFVAMERPSRVWQGALMAAAHHQGPRADQVMEGFTDPSRPARLRKQTAFWLGAARRDKGLDVLRRMVADDPSSGVRKQAVFGIYVSQAQPSGEILASLARRSPHSGVRRQALFWLAQKAGAKAAETLNDVAENDPQTEIQMHAVFGLSQMADGEGIPHLIRIARTHPNGRVRKRAIFWLGQSDRPEVLEFFEEVLGIRRGGQG